MSEELFTTKMKKATRDIHAISDSLVTAKLAMAMSDDRVWADGLLVFYEIFRYLEEAMDRCPETFLGDLCIYGMKRTRAFQEDLNYYLTTSWTNNYMIRDSVANYLLHLQKLEAADPNLLLPYVYHLYMGLLTGGQILNKKRELTGNVFHEESPGGNAVTHFGNRSPYQIKTELKYMMNSISEMLDEETRERLIEESKAVFVMNNELIRSVRGTYRVVVKKLLMGFAIVIVFYILAIFLRDFF